MNSPVRAMVKKDVVRHAKTAACKGWFKSRAERMVVMMSTVKAARLGRFDVGGARRLAPSKASVISPCCTSQD